MTGKSFLRISTFVCCALLLSFPARADDAPSGVDNSDAAGQAQDAADSSSTATSALSDDRAANEASQTFDNTAGSATTPDGDGLQPAPFSAEPNN